MRLSGRKNPTAFGGGAQGVLLFGIGSFYGRAAQKIIYADIIEVGEFVQRWDRYIQIAQFIIRVCGLVDIQKDGKLFLRQVTILAQITDAKLIHKHHPRRYFLG